MEEQINEENELSKVYHPPRLSFQQEIEFKQETFPHDNVYQIFSPKISTQKKENRKRAFNIDAIPLKKNLLVSNLPLIERARMQKYNIYCTPKQYDIMVDAPKYIFRAYHFYLEYNGQSYSKTHYFAIAPTLHTQQDRQLPVLYRFSVCRDTNNPEHFSFNLYAIVGGYKDGFYFISRLDNNDQELAHIVKTPKIKSQKVVQPHKPNCANGRPIREVVPFPHIHKPIFTHDERDKREHSYPIYLPDLKSASFNKCLEEFMNYYNISNEMMLVRENCKIEKVIKTIKIQNLKKMLKTMNADDLAKIDKHNFEDYTKHADLIQTQQNIPEQKTSGPYYRS